MERKDARSLGRQALRSAAITLETFGRFPRGLTKTMVLGWFEATLAKKGNFVLELHFVPAEAMRTLNRSYRSVDNPTDILEFPTATAAKKEPVTHLGSILVSEEEVARKLGYLPTVGDWEVLLAHGLQNLLRYHQWIS